MKVILNYKNIDACTPQAGMIREWIEEIMKDKSVENLSPLRYADEVRIEE